MCVKEGIGIIEARNCSTRLIIDFVFIGLEIKPKQIDFSKQRSMRRSTVTTVDCDLYILARGTAVEMVKDTAVPRQMV